MKLLTKKIRDAMGRWQTLTSWDGETWALDHKPLLRRMRRAEALHPGYIDSHRPAALGHDCNCPLIGHAYPTLDSSVILHCEVHSTSLQGPRPQLITHHGTLPSKDKAKRARKLPRQLAAPHYRSSQFKGIPNTSIARYDSDRHTIESARPTHKHWCHGKLYDCQCDTPWLRRPCGADRCLVNGILLKEVKK